MDRVTVAILEPCHFFAEHQFWVIAQNHGFKERDTVSVLLLGAFEDKGQFIALPDKRNVFEWMNA